MITALLKFQGETKKSHYILCFIFICYSKRTFSRSRRYFREPLIRFNFPAISAYTIACARARAHTYVWSVSLEFSHGRMALLGNGWKGYCRRRAKVEDPGYFSRRTSSIYFLNKYTRDFVPWYLHALMKPRETTSSKTSVLSRVGGRVLEIVLYIAGTSVRLNREKESLW